ncbi:MAG TPA: glycosyltransferase family 39 protein, partial [Puia sp.]|nr:glycosyltransferase family 39 protein [Puia sp.]
MNLPSSPVPNTGKLFYLLAFFFILQLAVAFLTYEFGFRFDEAMWEYIGRNWIRHGLIPYQGGVDNKSPLIFAIYGLSDRIFGVNYIFPRIIGAVSQTIGLFFLYRIGEKVAGRETAFLALILYGLSLLWRSTGGKYVSFTESYSVTAVIISFYFFLSAEKPFRYFLSGLVAGIGGSFRLTAFFPAAAILIIASFRSRRMAFVFLLGLLTGVILFVLFLWLCKINISEFIAYGITDNFGSGSATDHNSVWKLMNFLEKFFYSELILFYPALIGYFFMGKK